MDAAVTSPVTAAARYSKLATEREPYLKIARDAAKLTIPNLFPYDTTSTSKPKTPALLTTPWQSVGSRGVNNLSSKLLLALLPPNEPFFKYVMDSKTVRELAGDDAARSEIERILGDIEREIMREIERTAVRVSAFEALKHLLVAGNVLVYMPPKGGLRVYRLDRYVVRRDPMGNPMEVIVIETLDRRALPPRVRAVVEVEEKSEYEKVADGDKPIDLYTRLCRDETKWTIHQEVMGQIVPGTEGTYPLDKCPWLALRFTKIDGEDYGRGYVEEYMGDLLSLESLAKAIVEGSEAAAKTIFLVRPGGHTSVKDLKELPNCGIANGNAEDVTTVRIEKAADLRVAADTANQLRTSLSFAFLLNSAIQRNGERVTAEEIRFMAEELESGLGGIYSILSQEFQLPLVKRQQLQMTKAGKLPNLPDKIVEPAIVTGLEAIGRGNDLRKLNTLIAQVTNLKTTFPRVTLFVDEEELLKRLTTAGGIDAKSLIRPQEKVAEMEQQMQMQAAANSIGPDATKTMIKGVMDNMAPANQAQGAPTQ